MLDYLLVIGVDGDVASRIAERVRSEAPERTEEERRDLMLAYACAERDAAAITEFLRLHGEAMRRSAARVLMSRAAIDDCVQRAHVKLFVGDERGPRIAAYKVGGRLGNWAQVVVFREALNLRKAHAARREVGGDDLLLAESLQVSGPDGEIIKQRYGAELKRAFRAVVEALPEDERALMRDHVLRGASIDAIGAEHRVDRATAARWLQRVRERIGQGVRDEVVRALKLNDEEYESLVRLVRSDVDLSWSALEA